MIIILYFGYVYLDLKEVGIITILHKAYLNLPTHLPLHFLCW